ncbi:filament-like plant protein isoform X2 [Bidens hawaiensis]|uniref:filament-like plant protein isoform X2 n=1 Tax=Bidens hawaiensis TaxID=980011 RepID=UPI00404A4473
MEKKSWLWKRKSSDRSPGETESSTSISSHSESNSDEKEGLRKSMNHSQSPEVSSKASTTNSEASESYKSLTEKLSAALVNVGAKEDLVKQHAKVAEEAVAGWEKAENEVTKLKQELEEAVQQNLALEVRTNHLDGALKECVKQLRLAKEEQDQKINDIIVDKAQKWDLIKNDLEIQICTLQAKLQDLESCSVTDPKILVKLETLEKENSTLKFELNAQSEELEIRTIERDLSTQAAETASKQQLESIKKMAKLEAECRKLQSLTRKSPAVNDNHKAVSISSFYVDSLTDSQSVDSFKMHNLENNETEQGSSDSWAVALMAELDQFKSGKLGAKNVNVASCSEINNIMDDFLEMERIASLSEGQNETPRCTSETELEVMSQQVSGLKEKLEKLEGEKCELENALNSCKESLALSNAELADTKRQMVGLQKELTLVNESKEILESRIVDMEKNERIMSTEVCSIKEDVENERRFSSEMKSKCEQLEKELVDKTEEVKLQMVAKSNEELKVKQNLEVAAADRLSACQKTISSLARQLESLATLEDFLIDTANLPGFSGNQSVAKTGGELWKLHSNDTYMPKKTIISAQQVENNSSVLLNGDNDESPLSSSSSTSSLHHFGGRSRSKNSFEKLFSRSKSGVQGESGQG